MGARAASRPVTVKGTDAVELVVKDEAPDEVHVVAAAEAILVETRTVTATTERQGAAVALLEVAAQHPPVAHRHLTRPSVRGTQLRPVLGTRSAITLQDGFGSSWTRST